MGLCFNHQLRPTRQPWLGTFPHWWFPLAWTGVLVKQNQVVPSFAGKTRFISWYKLVKLPNYRYFVITIHPAVQCHFNQRREKDFANVRAPGHHGQVMVYGSVWDEATWLVGISHGPAKWCQILENLRYYWHVDFAAPPIGCFALCTSLHHYWLVVSNMFYFPSHIWDNPSHWHIFFQIVIAPPTRLFWWTLGGQQLVLVSGIQWWNHHWWPVKNAASPAKECSVFGFPEYQDGPLEGDIINIYIYIWFLSLFVYNPSCDNTCLVKLLFQNTNGHLYII